MSTEMSAQKKYPSVMVSEHSALAGLVERLPYVLERCRGKRVLHVGCCDSPMTDQAIAEGTLLHAKIVDVAGSCVGADIDETSLEKLRTLMPEQTFVASDICEAEGLKPLASLEAFNVVVAGEILEHLNNPVAGLTGLAQLLKSDGVIVASVPNAMSLKGALRGLMRKEIVHRDHIAYYSPRTLRALGERAGLQVGKAYGYNVTPRSGLKRLLTKPLTWLSPNLADGLVVEYAPLARSE